MTTKTAKSRKSQFDPAEFDAASGVTEWSGEAPPAEEMPPDSPEQQEAMAEINADLDSPEAIAACQERGAIALKAMTTEANPTVAKYRAIAEIEDQLVAQNLTFREAEIEFNRADKHAKALKKAMEAEQSRLNGLVQNLSDAMSGNFTPSLPFPDETTETPESEAWRAVTLEDLGITGTIAEKLTEAGITNLGAIASWSDSGKQFTDIAGIGPSKAEKIFEATEEYWRNNPLPVAGLPDCAGDTLNGNVTNESSEGDRAFDAIPDAVRDE